MARFGKGPGPEGRKGDTFHRKGSSDREEMPAPPSSTRKKGKNSPDSKGPSANGWTKGATKKPAGC